MLVRNKIFSLLLILLWVAPALAMNCDDPNVILNQDLFSNLTQKSCENDRSIFYLGGLFGNVGNLRPEAMGYGSMLLGDLFRLFNIIVLTLGGLIVSYSMVVSTIATAQEGEVMGKKFSSIWIPVRSAIGIAMLIPTASGYSIIQVLVMQIVLLSIDNANRVWYFLLQQSAKTNLFASGYNIDSNLNNRAVDILASELCLRLINEPNSFSDSSGPVSQRINTDRTMHTGDNGIIVDPFVNSAGVQAFRFGVSSTAPNINVTNTNICGMYDAGLKPSSFGFEVRDQDAWNRAFSQSLQNGRIEANYHVNRMLENVSAADFIEYHIDNNLQYEILQPIDGMLTRLKPPLLAAPQIDQTTNYQKQYIQEGLNTGWLFAGGYYFKFLTLGNTSGMYSYVPAFNYTPPAIPTSTYSFSRYIAQKYVNTTTLPPTDQLFLGANAQAFGKASKFLDAFSKPMKSLAFRIMQNISAKGYLGDPLDSARNVGRDIVATVENIFFGIITVGFTLLLVSCIFAGKTPLCWGVQALINVGILIITFVLTFLWSFGVLMGMYVPLIPYITFTFTALGWLLLVIEAMVAAPVVALGFVSPAQENLGKATPSVMLIISIFLRPTLMVIGFILAAKLLRAAVLMLNYGFEATINASISGMGIFGAIALISLYVGIFMTIVKECFSLIYVLPDKVIRWIGGQPERSEVSQQLDATEKAAEEGAKLTGAMAKGATKMAASLSKKIANAKKDGKGGGGGAGGLGAGGKAGGGGAGGGKKDGGDDKDMDMGGDEDEDDNDGGTDGGGTGGGTGGGGTGGGGTGGGGGAAGGGGGSKGGTASKLARAAKVARDLTSDMVHGDDEADSADSDSNTNQSAGAKKPKSKVGKAGSVLGAISDSINELQSEALGTEDWEKRWDSAIKKLTGKKGDGDKNT